LDVPVLTSQPVIGVILRAALAMHPGFMRVFPQAESAFISAYRKHANNSDDFTIKVEYISTPDLEGKTLILLDPMIATGRTMVLCHNQFLNYGTPAQVILCGVIGSEEGIEYLTRHLPHAHIYVGAVDSELTARGYIVPGLGDAGDLAFGEKL
jgi:uracil phosphoribosyltransferase